MNEKRVLEALAEVPHEHIMYFLAAWAAPNASYMLFPLADGDLHHFFISSPPPIIPPEVGTWLVEQMLGICDALKYVHEHVSSDGVNQLTRRIGFHHDLKPANIPLFRSDKANRAIWKTADFGSGAVKHLSLDSNEELYNRKASTGDPVYSAPEYVVEGRVSRPKDIWSLGCIFFEVLVWVFTPNTGAVGLFREARDEFRKDNPDNAPVYWCQDSEGWPYMNPAIIKKTRGLRDSSQGGKLLSACLACCEADASFRAERAANRCRGMRTASDFAGLDKEVYIGFYMYQ